MLERPAYYKIIPYLIKEKFQPLEERDINNKDGAYIKYSKHSSTTATTTSSFSLIITIKL